MVSTPNKPQTNLPALAAMQSKAQWVCWCLEETKDGRKTKVPYNARTGYKASSTNPQDWSTYDIACRAQQRGRNASDVRYDGIGFVFNEDYTGIDFDHCVKEDGTIEAWAQKWLDILNSFSEFSPSRTGIHVYAEGLIPETPNMKGELVRQGKKVILNKETQAAIEMYSQGRFFTVTGHHIESTPTIIEARQEEIEALYAELQAVSKANTPAKEPAPSKQAGPDNLTDSELINKALDAKNGTTFRALWNGDTGGHGGDHSSADLALCNLLAFWTNKDDARMDRLFRQSGLYREDKWDRNARSGETYGQGTITRAIHNCRETYTGEQSLIDYQRFNSTTAYTAKAPAPASVETDTIDQALETGDLTLLYDAIPDLAQLSKADYLRYESKIKETFRKVVNMNTFAAAISEARKAVAVEPARGSYVEYEKTDIGMVYNTASAPLVLSNFTAEIIADITTDDGAEQTRSYELEAEISSRRFLFEIPAKEFTKCDWIDERLGARARVTTGQSIKSHLINAIKYCSDPNEQFHYAHTGWRKIDGQMVYLHNGGILSQVSQVEEKEKNYLTQKTQFSETAYRANGERERVLISQVSQVSQVNKGVCVKLSGPLARYEFPSLDSSVTIQAARCSLRYTDLADDIITMPLYASMYRAVLGEIDYGVHLAGQSGQGKTELVALLQAHYGPEMNAHKLPGSWESTENSLEMLLFQAKDALVVVDDFKPKGGKVDQDRLHAKADRVFRSIGNGSGRGRLKGDLTQHAERRPRCLLISTGEDVPRGQSLKARGVVLTMPGSITLGEASKRLAQAQKDARSGLYAQAMAAYITWLAPQIEAIQEQLPELIAAERESLNLAGHARTGTNTANMVLGMKFFLRFAVECEAISEDEAQAYLTRCLTAFKKIAAEAASENHQDKPSEQWRRLIIAAIANKTAHLVTANGDFPGLEYGWVKSVRTTEHDGQIIPEETVRGGGTQIGWIDGDNIYLLPAAAYKVAKSMGTQTGDEVVTLETTLRKFLYQDKMLASTELDKARKTITVRRRLENTQRDVLHLSKGVFYPDAPPVDSVDSVDIVDSEPLKVASIAASRVSQVVDSEPRESSEKHDSVTQKVTHFPGKVPHQEVFERFKSKFLQVGTKNTIQWYVPGSSYAGRGYDFKDIRVDACIDRLRDELDSGNEMRIRAAIRYMRTHLREAN